MDIIDESAFKESMKNLIAEINQNNSDINDKVNEAIKNFKLEFNDVEKLLVARCLKTLNEKLKEYKEKEMTYDELQCWGREISFDVSEWPEYKAYRKFFKRIYVDTEALNKSLSNSFRKYGLSHGGIHRSESFGERFSYQMFNLYPGIQYKINE